MKLKDTRTLMERANDLEMVLTFSILRTVEKYYHDLENYRSIYSTIVSGKATSQMQVEFCKRFGFGKELVRKILGSTYDDKGKRHYVTIAEVRPFFTQHFHYQRHFKKQFKSGNCFQVHGYWYLDFDRLSNLMTNKDAHDTNSDFYTKRQHHYIDRLILKFKPTDHTTPTTYRPVPKQIQTILAPTPHTISKPITEGTPNMTDEEFKQKALRNYLNYIHRKNPQDYMPIEVVIENERWQAEWKKKRLAEIEQEKIAKEKEENEISPDLLEEMLKEVENLDF